MSSDPHNTMPRADWSAVGVYIPPRMGAQLSRAADRLLARRAGLAADPETPQTYRWIPHTPEQAAAFRRRAAAKALASGGSRRRPVSYEVPKPPPSPRNASPVQSQPKLPAVRSESPSEEPRVAVPRVRRAIRRRHAAVASPGRVSRPKASRAPRAVWAVDGRPSLRWLCLSALMDLGSACYSEVAEVLEYPNQTVSATLVALHRGGFVRVARKRSIRGSAVTFCYALTKSGRAAVLKPV